MIKESDGKGEEKVMRKNIARALVMMTVMAAAVAFSACESRKATETTVAATETTAAMAETSAAESGAEEQIVTGTISEIKDFMFTVETEDGKAYAFAFEQGKEPKGLADVKDGDKVTVTYTGDLSEVDVFEGTIVSVKVAK